MSDIAKEPAGEPAASPGLAGAPSGERPGLLGWYRELEGTERRTFWGCWAGWSLDSMDANLYSFVIPTLIGLWGMSRADAGLIATGSLIASALGGWLAGIMSDRVGRVRLLQITVAWYAIFTGLSALTFNFDQLLVVRILQGLGFGGEWAAGAVLMGEMIRDRHRGKGTGVVHSGWAIGWGAAALIYAVSFSVLPKEIAWRVLFAVGVLPAVAVLFMRRFIPEPPIYERSKRRKDGASAAGGLGIFSFGALRATIFGSLLSVGAQGGFYAIAIWLPTYLKTERHLSVLNTGGYLAVIIISSFLGYIAGAYLTDAIGRRRTFVLFSACAVITVIAYTAFPISDSLMLLLGIPLGFFPSGCYSGIPALLNEIYPTRIRGSGLGFCFNFGRAVGALFPTLVGVLSASISLGAAIGWFSSCAYGLLVLSALLLPETSGRSLKV
jgi:MFS family permease